MLRDTPDERLCREFHVPYWVGLNYAKKPSWFRRPIWRFLAHWWYWRHHHPWVIRLFTTRWWAVVIVLIGIAIGNLLIPYDSSHR